MGGTIPIPAEHDGSKKSPQTKYQITGTQRPPKRSLFLIKGHINSCIVILEVIYFAALIIIILHLVGVWAKQSRALSLYLRNIMVAKNLPRLNIKLQEHSAPLKGVYF